MCQFFIFRYLGGGQHFEFWSPTQLESFKLNLPTFHLEGGGGVCVCGKAALVTSWGVVALFGTHSSHTVSAGCFTVVTSRRLRSDRNLEHDIEAALRLNLLQRKAIKLRSSIIDVNCFVIDTDASMSNRKNVFLSKYSQSELCWHNFLQLHPAFIKSTVTKIRFTCKKIDFKW